MLATLKAYYDRVAAVATAATAQAAMVAAQAVAGAQLARGVAQGGGTPVAPVHVPLTATVKVSIWLTGGAALVFCIAHWFLT
jgi:hypothetical protein